MATRFKSGASEHGQISQMDDMI